LSGIGKGYQKKKEREREREKIDLMNESFPLPNIKRLKFENKVKSIETSLSKIKNTFYLSTFSRNPHWLCWYKASRQRGKKQTNPLYI
jgi:hypothetical protein